MSEAFYSHARLYDLMFPGGGPAVDFYRADANRHAASTLHLRVRVIEGESTDSAKQKFVVPTNHRSCEGAVPRRRACRGRRQRAAAVLQDRLAVSLPDRSVGVNAQRGKHRLSSALPHRRDRRPPCLNQKER